MSECPNELRYSKTHEWVRVEQDDVVTIGITDHAQSLLGDLVFVELPHQDTETEMGDEVAVVESVKTAADIYTPVAGEIIEINEQLSENPDAINQDPYGQGWIFRVKMADVSQLDELLDADGYKANIEE